MLTLFILLSTLFADANQQYADGNYAEAASMYEQVLQENPAAEVYYNLGNARFKQGELAQAILAYERCLRLNPRMKDARHNLEFAESRIKDNIRDTNTFFLKKWYLTVRNSLSESTWAWMSVSCFILFLHPSPVERFFRLVILVFRLFLVLVIFTVYGMPVKMYNIHFP